MMNASLWLFFLLVLGVIALPGMDMAYVVASALAGGARVAAAAVAGIVVGGAVHVVTATLGVSALLAAFPHALRLLVLAGAAYMAWMGLHLMRFHAEARAGDAPAAIREDAAFRYGVVTCLVNPKAYAFMLAVFPAFLHTAARPVALQAVALGAIAASTQAAVYGGVAFLALRLRHRFDPRSSSRTWMQRGVGSIMLVSAAFLARGWLGF